MKPSKMSPSLRTPDILSYTFWLCKLPNVFNEQPNVCPLILFSLPVVCSSELKISEVMHKRSTVTGVPVHRHHRTVSFSSAVFQTNAWFGAKLKSSFPGSQFYPPPPYTHTHTHLPPHLFLLSLACRQKLSPRLNFCFRTIFYIQP